MSKPRTSLDIETFVSTCQMVQAEGDDLMARNLKTLVALRYLVERGYEAQARAWTSTCSISGQTVVAAYINGQLVDCDGDKGDDLDLKAHPRYAAIPQMPKVREGEKTLPGENAFKFWCNNYREATVFEHAIAQLRAQHLHQQLDNCVPESAPSYRGPRL